MFSPLTISIFDQSKSHKTKTHTIDRSTTIISMNTPTSYPNTKCYDSPSAMRKSRRIGGKKRVRFVDEKAVFRDVPSSSSSPSLHRMARPCLPSHSEDDVLRTRSRSGRILRHTSDPILLRRTAVVAKRRVSSDPKLSRCRWQTGSSNTDDEPSLQNTSWDLQPSLPHRRSSTGMAPILESPCKKRQSLKLTATGKDSLIRLPTRKASMEMINWNDVECTSPVSTILSELGRGLLDDLQDCPLECPVRQCSLNDLDDAFVTVPL